MGVEISSKNSLLAVMILLPLFIAGSSWYVMGGTPSVGVTQRSFTAPPDQLNASLHWTLVGLGDFFYKVAEVQRDILTKGLRALLLGTFIGGTLISTLTLVRPLSDGTVTFEIGLVRDKRKVLLYRTVPVVVYSLYLSAVLALFAHAVLPPKAGFSLDFERTIWLFAVLFLSSLWGLILSAFVGFYTREQTYPIVASFIISLASLTEFGDVVYPHYRILNALWISSKLLNAQSGIGIALMAFSAILAVYQFERGEYY